MDPVTNQASTEPKPAKPIPGRGSRIVGYIVSAVINLFLIYLVNNVLRDNAQFITPRWHEVQNWFNVSFALNIIVYLSFIIHDGRLYYYFARLALDIVGIIVSIRLLTVFPFDFSKLWSLDWMNNVFPILLWLGIAGILVGMIARTVRLVRDHE